ncbi:MAG: acyl-CoA-binding protein [Burkholderiaceae bacterium]
MPDLDAAFDIAAANSKNLLDDPQGDAQLELYAYHQQAQHGDNHAPQPDADDAPALARWAAWTRFAGVDRTQAKQQYVTLLGAIG